MLMVILISAAPDGAAPGSRAIGSAFDPATSSVAVGRQQARKAAPSVPDNGQPARPLAGASGLDAAAPQLALASSGFAANRSPRPVPPDTPYDPRSLNRAHGARAPPAA
jgi:hypothetical protein